MWPGTEPGGVRGEGAKNNYHGMHFAYSLVTSCIATLVDYHIIIGEDMLDFDHRGLIPPFVGKATDFDRSPYFVSLLEFVDFFTTGRREFDILKRITLLKNFMEYRKMLHSSGLTSGFQWVNGSFVTNKEEIKKEAPNDIDVVTIFILGSGISQQSFAYQYPYLFDNEAIKNGLHIDSHYLVLEQSNVNLESLIEQINYWNNLWSHQRDTLLWKGYIRLDLSPDQDDLALKWLERLSKGVENA